MTMHPLENDAIRRFSSESLYSYSFTSSLSSTRSIRSNRRHMIRHGLEFAKRVRWKLDDRRFSQPDLGEAIEWQQPGYWSAQNTPRSSIDEDPVLAVRRQTLPRALPPIYEEISAEDYCKRSSLHVPTRFLPQNQAIFTTDQHSTILLFNDIASLCFGMDKSYVGKSILGALQEPHRQKVVGLLKQRESSSKEEKRRNRDYSVLVCGSVMPIVKVNGEKSAASLWLKEKQGDNGQVIYLWIFEEIYESALSAHVDQKGIITRVMGKVQELYGYKDSEIVGQPISSLIPAVWNDEASAADLGAVEQFRFFGSRTKSGVFFPVMVTTHKEEETDNIVLKITSLPTVAGIITVHKDGTVQSLSPVPAKYLFGYPRVEKIIEKTNIASLIPQFPAVIEGLKREGISLENGSLISNHTCRRALSNELPPQIYAVHRDGSRFHVQIRLRSIESTEEDLISIWVTFDRIHAVVTEPPVPTPKKSPENVPVRRIWTPTAGPETKAEQDRPPPLPTDKKHPLDDYVFEDTLGEGAYGVARLAYRKDDETKKKVVIKCINKSRIIVDSWMRDRRYGDLVPAEIHILRTLQQHPHVNCCSLLTHMEDEDYYYLVMKLHGNGMDLFDYIEVNENMTEQQVKAIFRQVSEAVRHLHHLRIVHRDIKDENIILDESGTVLLIDFGSAAYFRPGKKFETFSGTLDYWAPELLQGISYEGPPQDIWSLGILLHTLIFRETPFYQLDDILEGDLRIRELPYPGPSNLLHRMLNRDVTKRPTIDEVLMDPWLAS